MTWSRTRLFIQAWNQVAVYDWTFARGGFPAVYRNLIQQRVAKQQRQPDIIAGVCDVVNLAACFYYKPVRCLQRAVVTVLLLRRHGIAADLVIASRHSPLFVHAWAEVDGRIVNDSAGYAERLTVLHRQQSSAAGGGRRG